MSRLIEQDRNRLLRRVDWRFLLPDPFIDRALCLAGGDLRDACALIAHRLDGEPNVTSAGYDVVVAVDPDAHAVSDAHAMLRPGGHLVVEWTHVTRREIERRLASAGFEDARCFWCWPTIERAEAWVPCDVPAMFDAYERTDRALYVGTRHRFGTLIRRRIARSKVALGQSVPLLSVARRASEPGDTETGAHESAIVRVVRSETGMGAANLTVGLLTGGPRSISKVVGLVYAEPTRDPIAAIKWPRVPESVTGLAREADALVACHARAPLRGVPHLLGRATMGDIVAIAETAERGTPMFRHLSRQSLDTLARQGAAWLAAFNAHNRALPNDRHTVQQIVGAEIARFAETFGPVIDASLLEETARLCSDLGELPCVIEHRDFGPWNILVDPAGNLSVLDWESSRIRGFPLLDLVYFLTYLAFFVDGAMLSRRFVESYRRSLDPSTLTGATRFDLLERHREAWGISSRAARALRALCWIGHAESEFQHFSADAAGPPSPDALRASVFAQLWREEMVSIR